MIMGIPNGGKSTSLRNLPQPDYMYLNTDLKELPFKPKFKGVVEVSDAANILNFIPQIEQEASVSGVVLDTLTFLMDMYERQYVAPHAGTKKGQSAWGDYAKFYGDFIHQIKAGTKDYIVMAHDKSELNENTMEIESKIPVKGAVGKRGVEGDFSFIVAARQVSIKELDKHLQKYPECPLLNITEDEREDGFKYVFQTRPFKGTGSTCRAPLMFWNRADLYIDNDANVVMDKIKEFYAD